MVQFHVLATVSWEPRRSCPHPITDSLLTSSEASIMTEVTAPDTVISIQEVWGKKKHKTLALETVYSSYSIPSSLFTPPSPGKWYTYFVITSYPISQGKFFSKLLCALKFFSTSKLLSLHTQPLKYKVLSSISLSACPKGEIIRPYGLEQLLFIY